MKCLKRLQTNFCRFFVQNIVISGDFCDIRQVGHILVLCATFATSGTNWQASQQETIKMFGKLALRVNKTLKIQI